MKRACCVLLVFLLIFAGCGAEPEPDVVTEGTAPASEADKTDPHESEVPPDITSEDATEDVGTTEPDVPAGDPTDAFIKTMTLEEKVGQLFFISPENLPGGGLTSLNDAAREAIDTYHPGGFVLFGVNITDPEQLKAFTADLRASMVPAPVLAVDEEGGNVARIANAGFDVPKYASMGAVGDMGDPDEAWKAGKNIGSYLREYGFTLDLAPVADVNSNPYNPVIGRRAFSSDPYEASVMVEMFIDGLHENGVLSCIKHFPGHGDTYGDTHEGFVLLDKSREELDACELIPFKENLAHTDAVMVAHVSLPQLTGDNTPASLSKAIVTGLLRDELGFDGLVMTDSLEMSAITDTYGAGEAAVLAIEAGNDVLLGPADYVVAYNAVLEAVKSGRISETRLDESVRRILIAKGY